MVNMYSLLITLIIGTVYSVERITFATWNTKLGTGLADPADLASKLPAVDVYVFQEVLDEFSISQLSAQMPTDDGQEWDFAGLKDTPTTDNLRTYKMYVLYNKNRATNWNAYPKRATWTQKKRSRHQSNVIHELLQTTPHIEFDFIGADNINYKVISVHLKATLRSDINENTKESKERLEAAKAKRKAQGDELVKWYEKRWEIFTKKSKQSNRNEQQQAAFLAKKKLVILGDFNGLYNIRTFIHNMPIHISTKSGKI